MISAPPVGDEAEGNVARTLLRAAPGRIAPAAAAARLGRDHVAGADHDADLLGLQHALLAPRRAQHVAMRLAILAAQDAAGAVLHAVARGVADGRLGHLDGKLQVAARAAAKAPVAAAVRPELVTPEEQREAHLGNLQAAELDAARGLPLARARPAVAGRRGAAAGPRLEQMPDEGLARARIDALDRDAEAAAPTRHGALRAGRARAP